MKSLNTSYLYRLDHLRFFAAVFVVMTHLRGEINWDNQDTILSYLKLWIQNGSSGVSLFLVLSGFLFTIISGLGENKIKYSRYIYNRILRIFPLLIFLFFIIISVARKESTPIDILRLITLQLNTGHPWTGWGQQYYPSGPIWTIAVEFQFYLIFPFLAIFLHKFGTKHIFYIILLMIAVKFNIAIIKSGDIYYNLYHTIVGRLDQFCIGMLIAYSWEKGHLKSLQKKHISFTVTLICLLSLTYMFTFPKRTILYSTISFSIEAICYGLITACYLTVSLPNITIINKTLSKLGEISFSIYLLHLPTNAMLNILFDFGKAVSLTELAYQLSIKLPIIIMVSFFTYNIIEKPFMSFRVKYT